MAYRKVDLPEPDGPVTTRSEPAGTLKRAISSAVSATAAS